MRVGDKREGKGVAVLGATGIVGQVFVWMLSRSNLFEPACLTASGEKTGRTYGGSVRWQLPFELPPGAGALELAPCDPAALRKAGVRIVFSALPAGVARGMEPLLRDEGFLVFSNAAAMRHEPDVPILIPEVNPEALPAIERQGYPRKGFVVTNPNCSTTGLALALAPLRRFGIMEVFVTTYQAVSGAGYPGIPSLDIDANVIPRIDGEEEKIGLELRRILGIPAAVYASCARVPVRFGHLEAVWLKLEKDVSESEVLGAWEEFTDPLAPSSKPVVYMEGPDQPQPRSAFFGDPPGMQVFTGRLRKIDGRIGFFLLVNNIVRGAAGGSIRNAECFVERYGWPR